MSRRRAIRKLFALARRYETMRKLSDNFGFGPVVRYGDDRWGKSKPAAHTK